MPAWIKGSATTCQPQPGMSTAYASMLSLLPTQVTSIGEFSAAELLFPCRTPLSHPFFHERYVVPCAVLLLLACYTAMHCQQLCLIRTCCSLAAVLLESMPRYSNLQTRMPQLACRLWELFTLPPVIPLEQRKVVLYLSRSHGGASNGGRQVCVAAAVPLASH